MRLKKESGNAIYGRDCPRVPKTLSLVFKSKTSLINAFSGNASDGGLYIKTPKPLAKGEQFSLKLKLPENPTPLNTKCEVVWSRSESSDPEQKPVGMGVKFIEISDADRQRLEKELKMESIDF